METIKHLKQSAVSDGGDTSLVRPSDWNAALKGVNGVHRDFLMRDTGDATYGLAWRKVGRLYSLTTVTGTGANTTETDLLSQALPAALLDVDGMAIRVRAWGTTAANANNKTAKLYFGAASISTGAVALNAGKWDMEFVVVRTGAATQEIVGSYGSSITGTLGHTVAQTTGAETLSGAVTVKVTGQNGTASASDIVARGMIIEALN